MRSPLPYILLLALAMTSCSKDTDFDLDTKNPNLLVIDGWVTTGSGPFEINLSLTGEFKSLLPPTPVQGALVQLTQQGTGITLEETEPGAYETPDQFQLNPGEEVQFFIQYQGEVYTYEADVPDEPTVLGIEIDQNEEDSAEVVLDLQFENSGTQYVLLELFALEIEDGDTTKTDLFGGISASEVTLLDAQAGEPTELDLFAGRLELIPEGTLLQLEVHILEQDQYEYLTSLRQDLSGNLFSPYPANPPIRFSNEALGIIFTTAVATVVVER